MQRGLKIFLAGFLPLFLFAIVGASADRGSVGARANIQIGLVSAAALFMLGTTLIVTDKGHHWLTGVLLSLFTPLGTLVALILPDRRPRSAAASLEDSLLSTTQESHTAESFQKLRTIIINVAVITAIVYGLLQFLFFAGRFLSFEGGMFEGKILIAGIHGFSAGFSLWGAAVMLSVALAPRAWLLNSATGQSWMNRTGIKNVSSTTPLRILAALIGIAAASWFVLSIAALLSALFAGQK